MCIAVMEYRISQRIKRIALAVATTAAAACATNTNLPEVADNLAPAATTVVAEDCQPVTSLEVVHRVNGAQVTDRLRLVDDASQEAALTLRSFQLAVDHFGAANVISTRPIHQVYCYPQGQAPAARRAIVRADDPPGSALCVFWGGVQDCTALAPSHTYDYAQTESCSFTNFTDAVSASCDDSRAIVTRHGDVVLTINTQNVLADIASRTQVLRALLGNANILTNIHFDISVTPDQQASIVDAQAFNNIAQQIQQASSLGKPLPDIQEILHNLQNQPTNVEFYTQLLKAQQTKLDRLKDLNDVTSGRLLSAAQVNAIYKNFVTNGKTIDKLVVDHSPAAMSQAAQIVNNAITQLGNASPASTVYNEVKAGTDALTAAHAPGGVFDPDHKVDFVVPDLYQSLTDADVEKRLLASDLLRDFNKQLQTPAGAQRGRDMSAGMRGVADAMKRGDQDASYRLYDSTKATEFYFDHDDPAGTSYDVHLTPEAAAMFNITVAPNTAAAYEVILVLNEAATFNAQTGKVTVDYTAVITLNARSAVSADSVARATYHTEEAWGTLSFLKNAGAAVAAAYLADLALDGAGVIEVIREGWGAASALRDHLRAGNANWKGTMEAVIDQGLDVLRRWPNMTPAEGADLVARIAGQIMQTIPAEVLASEGAQAAIDEAVRLYLDKASRGLSIVDRSGVALQEESAVELVKQLEQLEVTSLDESIEIADVVDNNSPCALVGTVLGGFAPGVTSGDDKPPCTPQEVVEAFARARAEGLTRFGLKTDADIHDMLKSRENIGPPFVVPNEMDLNERAFADLIVNHEGGNGTFVGQRVWNRPAIDGFWGGEPIQLKTQPTDSMLTAKDALTDTRNEVIAQKLRGVRIFQRLENITRARVLEFVNNPRSNVLTIPKAGGSIRSIDILTSDGFWLHIQNGIISG